MGFRKTLIKIKNQIDKINFISYFLDPLSIKRKIKLWTNRNKNSKLNCDDFDWDSYTLFYKTELRKVSQKHTQLLKTGDYEYKFGELNQKNKNILPLHPNHRLLYETILQLKPKKVFELGCGGGDHLANNIFLNKGTTLYGLDISSKQISLLIKRHGYLNAWLTVWDSKKRFPENFPTVDLGYSQAVIMHIHEGDGHLLALENLFRISKKYVVLMENWRSHNFVEDIKNLHSQGKISWKELYLYFRRAPEFDNKPHILVAASAPISNYELLDEDSVLIETISKV